MSRVSTFCFLHKMWVAGTSPAMTPQRARDRPPMANNKRMSLSSLKAMLASEKADALAAMSAAQLSGQRARAQAYYLGEMDQDMPALEGRSRAVSSDVADTIEGLMPGLMDIFCGSDEVVRFEPVGAEDEAAAQQE